MEKQQLSVNNSSFAVGRKVEGVLSLKNFFLLAPNAGASHVLEAALCSVAKGFFVLLVPGNVRFWFPQAPLHPPCQVKANDAEMVLGSGFWFVLQGGIYPDPKDSVAAHPDILRSEKPCGM